MPVTLVVEDDLTDVTARKLVSVANPNLQVSYTRVCGGSGYIRKNIRAFNNAARATSYLVITDLDAVACAPALVAEWLHDVPMNPGLVFRVAVREVEAWLLADRDGIAQFFGIAINRIPAYPEQETDPKRTLIRLASRSRNARIKRAIVPSGTARQGNDYNGCLANFVNADWDVERAAASAPSLERTILRVGEIQAG